MHSVEEELMAVKRSKMTKQEEIRKGIKDILGGYGMPDTYLNHETDKFLLYLHSQGVVIKAERELPSIRLPHSGYEAYLEEAQDDMLKAGYTATVPLIKEP